MQEKNEFNIEKLYFERWIDKDVIAARGKIEFNERGC